MDEIFDVSIPFQELPLSNDFMFGEVMIRPEICRMFLEALLDKKIARIEYINKQQDVSNSYTSHGIRMDVYLRDEANTVYSIEMQTKVGPVLFKRIRYYQGMIDRHNLPKAKHYSLLPESFIIMICTKDLIGRGLAVYKRKIAIEDCEDFDYNDGTHVYLLNSMYTRANAEMPILEFLDCIRTNDTNEDKYSSPLMKEVCPAIVEVRNDPGKEAEYMTWQTKMMDIEFEAMEKGRAEGIEEGRTEGIEEGIKNLVHTLHSLSIDQDTTVRQIVDRYNLTPDIAKEKVEQYWNSPS